MTTIRVLRKVILLRSVGAKGEPYPDWVRELTGKRGVYVVADKVTLRVRYVGCSNGSLRKTMTRHFQSWDKDNPWWGNLYRHVWFRREDCIAGFVLSAEPFMLEEQLIDKLDPTDNWYRPEKVPF